MINTDNLALFMLATITLNLTPGPDMMYVIARSVSESKKAGIASAFGIAAGTICHTLAVALGLSSLLLAVPTAYDIIKYIGGAYLVYLGVKILIKKQRIELESCDKKKSIKAIFYQGMITNLFNPKVALFFLAFLPQFIDPTSSNITLQILFLGLMFNLSGTIVNIVVALTASRLGKLLKHKLNNSSIFKWLTASVFMGLGIRLVLQERK